MVANQSVVNFIRKFYDAEANMKYEYERWRKSISSKRDYEQTLKSLLHHTNNRHFKSILEIGCGVGTWTIPLRNYCDRLTVLDISKGMVEITISRLRRLNFDKISGIVGNFQDPSLEINDKYDAIFCIRALELMENKISALSNMYKLLNNDGFVFIITINPYIGLVPFLSLITRKILKPPSLPLFFINHKNLLALMWKVGFKNVDAYPVIVSYGVHPHSKRPPLIERNETLLSNVIFNFIYKKRLNPLYLPLCIIESYCVTARK